MPYRSFADYLGLIYGQAGRSGVRGMIAVFLVLLVHETLHEAFGRTQHTVGSQGMPLIEAGVAVALILCALVASRFVGRLCASWGEAVAARSGRLRLPVGEGRFQAVAIATRAGMACGFVAVLVSTELALLFAMEMGAAIILVIPVGLGLPVLTVLAGVLLAEMRSEDAHAEPDTAGPRWLDPAAAVGGRRHGED